MRDGFASLIHLSLIINKLYQKMADDRSFLFFIFFDDEQKLSVQKRMTFLSLPLEWK